MIILKRKLKKIRFKLVLITGWKLATKGYANCSKSYRKKQQLKIVFYTIFNPIFASKWFEFLESPNFRCVSLHRPHLYIKPFRPFISIKWSKKQKVKVILDTYKFIKYKKEPFTQLLTHNEDKIITKLIFKDTFEGFLKLGYDDKFRKEGELVLSLSLKRNQIGGRISSIAISFEEVKNIGWVCIIGCVQGNRINAEYSSKLVQKLMHGLRPKSFLIFSVQELAKCLGCSAIYAVGNSIQAHRKKHAVHLPWLHNIHFDYDKFWGEVGGKSMGEGWFELPLRPVLKSIEEIKSHKRSMYRKRYQMLDNISLAISNSVNFVAN